jgi:hypothetical protein|tara:strand:+ start:266 stop:412 length:147 start_codon:yes stop_codon:yes gene_type:complete
MPDVLYTKKTDAIAYQADVQRKAEEFAVKQNFEERKEMEQQARQGSKL